MKYTMPASLTERINGLNIERKFLNDQLAARWKSQSQPHYEPAYVKDAVKANRRQLDKIDAQAEQINKDFLTLATYRVDFGDKLIPGISFSPTVKTYFDTLRKDWNGNGKFFLALFSGGQERDKKLISFTFAQLLNVPCYFFSIPRFLARYKEDARSTIENLVTFLSSYNEKAILVCKRLDVFDRHYEGTYKTPEENPTIHFWKNLKEIAQKNPKLVVIFTAQNYGNFSSLLKAKTNKKRIDFDSPPSGEELE